MGEVIHLARSPVSRRTVDELAALLHEARSGEVVGLAYVALHRGQVFTADYVGHAKVVPVYTLGAIHFLSDHIVGLKTLK